MSAPPLAELIARYLTRQVDSHAAGVATEPAGEVLPLDAVPAQAIDPRQSWNEATAALRYFDVEDTNNKAPGGWTALVAAQEPATGLAFAVGNFPQAVRDLGLLLKARPAAVTNLPPVDDAALDVWIGSAESDSPVSRLLLAGGALRLARRFEAAEEFLSRSATSVAAEHRAAWGNEEAALRWHRGRRDEAVAAWDKLPTSTPVQFNRGMAALFTGRPAAARPALQAAVDQIPDSSAWHHLGRLYLALAQM